ncbi:hypothetical protein K8Q94_00125 [Candidatus Nomurabacteria bacterium]|nr:hypothetical protein [Candidatus Nomurabacteria bacterium]
MSEKNKIRIGVLRGGIGNHYTLSLKKGGDIISYILNNFPEQYKVLDILIDKDGSFHLNGLPIKKEDLKNKIDVVWNTSHPDLSRIISNLSIPYVGVNSFASVLKDSKEILKEHMKKNNVNIPKYIVLPLYQKDFDGPIDDYAVKKAKKVLEKFGAPWIVKSLFAKKNIVTHVAKTFPELVNAISDIVKQDESVLVEELINGKKAVVHSVIGFRNQQNYYFPLISTEKHSFSKDEKIIIKNISENIFKYLNNPFYSKYEFILTSKGEIYVVNIDLYPDLVNDQSLIDSIKEVGTKHDHIFKHMIDSVLKL